MMHSCMNCNHEFESSISLDELGWHTVCPACESSFDVDVPSGRIKMLFLDTDAVDDFDILVEHGVPICSFYAFDSVPAFIAKWQELSDNPDSMWYFCYDGDIADENCFCSGACDPGDIQIFMEHFHCDEDGNHIPTPMERFKAEFTLAPKNTSRYLFAKYNPTTGRYDDKDGKLVYQKRLNGLFYDAQTNKPLIPQPPFYVAFMKRNNRPLAAKYTAGVVLGG